MMLWKPPALNASTRYGWPKGSDRRWRKLRAQALNTEPRCVLCLREGRLTAATTVDHIVPISEGGAKYDPTNCQSLCHEHAAAKTTSERTGQPLRIKGCTADGLPRDPNHAWNKERMAGGWVESHTRSPRTPRGQPRFANSVNFYVQTCKFF